MTAGPLRESINVQSPAATQQRDDYGHRTDDASNYVDESTIWANIQVKEDLSGVFVVRHSSQSTPITTNWRLTRDDGSTWIVKGAYDETGTREFITILAEPE